VEADLAPADRAVLARNFSSPDAALRLFTQAFVRNAAGVVDDYAALARPWGFAVDRITVPVGCWHGTLDSLVPLRHSEQLVARLPQARLVRWAGEGHLAIIERGGEVLDGLLELSRRERDFPGRTGSFGADDACASGEMGAR
jgi:pimeloyl-ACP methyl ester carboxylesterase